MHVSPTQLNLILALLISCLVHILLFYFFEIEFSVGKINLDKPLIFQLDLKEYVPDRLNTTEALSSEANGIKVIHAPAPSRAAKNTVHKISEGFLNQSSQESKPGDEFQFYLPSSLLDRKAVPISNIDISMVQGIFISGLPIKLRLYINTNGEVLKIESIAYLEQDQELKDKLVELLSNTTFLPAKKNGMDVNSYQDIEFAFKSSFIKYQNQ